MKYHSFVPMYDLHNRRIYPLVCPFNERDLSNDECYSGNGKNRCKFFVRYEWFGEHRGCIHCTHPPLDFQLSLFDF